MLVARSEVAEFKYSSFAEEFSAQFFSALLWYSSGFKSVCVNAVVRMPYSRTLLDLISCSVYSRMRNRHHETRAAGQVSGF